MYLSKTNWLEKYIKKKQLVFLFSQEIYVSIEYTYIHSVYV